MTVRKFQTRPVEVEAIQFDGSKRSSGEILGWIFDKGLYATARDDVIELDDGFFSGTLVHPGDWVVRGPKGGFFERVTSEEFDATYTPVIDSNADSDRRPHSRACGIRQHEHGTDCSRNCPTCGGYAL